MNRRRFLGLAAAALAAYPVYRVGTSILSGSETLHAFGGQVGRLKQSLLSPGFTAMSILGDSIVWGTGTLQGPSPNPRHGNLFDPRDNFASESFVNNFKRYIGGTFAPGAKPQLSNWDGSPSGQSIVEYVSDSKRIRISNQGINGASTYSYKRRNLVSNSAQNYAVLPDDNFVIVQLGTNDRGLFDVNPKNRQELAGRIVSLVEELSRSRDVILMCPNPATPEPKDKYRFGMIDVRSAIIDAARECRVDCIDNFAAFPSDPSSYLQDGLHPNVRGHRLISDNIQRAIELA